MKPKRDIFTFNHIDTSIDEVKLLEIKALYRFYHKRWWCYKKVHKYLKRMNLLCKLGSTALIATGAIAGGVTLNPIILGTISGAGLLVKTITDHKNYNRRIEMAKYAYMTYEKVLIELRSYMRGKQFDCNSFVCDMKVLDEAVTEQFSISCEIKLETRYEKKFNTS